MKWICCAKHIDRVAETGTGHAVLILGESGVGKSRLAAEAAAEARKRGMAVISVRCLGRGAEPLLPLKEALASYLGRTPDQIRRTLARAAPADPDTLYFLNYLFRKLRQVPVLAMATIQEEQLGDYPELADLMAEWSATGHAAMTVVPLERAQSVNMCA